MSLSTGLQEEIRHAVTHHGGPRGAMLEALRAVQQVHGWVSDEHMAEIAGLLGVPLAALESVATFYSLIFRRPVGETVILLCDGASCWMCGADEVRDTLMQTLGIGFGETTADGRYTLINICCVGACDRAPAAVVGQDRRLVGPLSARDALALIEEAGR
jgi:NADH-quinone oxidoreductase subunit E